jgi:hypothetical protein
MSQVERMFLELIQSPRIYSRLPPTFLLGVGEGELEEVAGAEAEAAKRDLGD